jgi:hypothetical protein
MSKIWLYLALAISFSGCAKQLNDIVGSKLPEMPNQDTPGDENRRLKISGGELRSSTSRAAIKVTISPTTQYLASPNLGLRASLSRQRM